MLHLCHKLQGTSNSFKAEIVEIQVASINFNFESLELQIAPFTFTDELVEVAVGLVVLFFPNQKLFI